MTIFDFGGTMPVMHIHRVNAEVTDTIDYDATDTWGNTSNEHPHDPYPSRHFFRGVSISEKWPYGPATLTALGRRFGKGSPVWRRDPKQRD